MENKSKHCLLDGEFNQTGTYRKWAEEITFLTERNKFRLTFEEIKKLKVINRQYIDKSLFTRNEVTNSWVLNEIVMKDDETLDAETYEEYWIGIYDETCAMEDKVKIAIYSLGGKLEEELINFYNLEESLDDETLKLQEKILKTVNALLDKRVLCFPYTTGWEKFGNSQWVKKLSLTSFEVIDVIKENERYIAYHTTIDLNDYSNEEIIKNLQRFNFDSIEELSETYGKIYDFVMVLFIVRNNLSNCESVRAANEKKLNKILNKMYGI